MEGNYKEGVCVWEGDRAEKDKEQEKDGNKRTEGSVLSAELMTAQAGQRGWRKTKR